MLLRAIFYSAIHHLIVWIATLVTLARNDTLPHVIARYNRSNPYKVCIDYHTSSLARLNDTTIKKIQKKSAISSQRVNFYAIIALTF